jgi:hypothetical protein
VDLEREGQLLFLARLDEVCVDRFHRDVVHLRVLSVENVGESEMTGDGLRDTLSRCSPG